MMNMLPGLFKDPVQTAQFNSFIKVYANINEPMAVKY
jgi:hypothetical protein